MSDYHHKQSVDQSAISASGNLNVDRNLKSFAGDHCETSVKVDQSAIGSSSVDRKLKSIAGDHCETAAKVDQSAISAFENSNVDRKLKSVAGDQCAPEIMEQQIATPSQQIVTLSAQLEELYKLEESLYPRSKNGNPKLRNHALRKIEAIWDGVGVTGVLDCWFPYVAMELFDRLPPLVNEDVDLVVVSCLTLACKMQKKKFHTTEFLLKCGLNYSLEEHVAMELRILRLLEWKMRPLTPFCFAKGFSHMLPASCDPRLVHRIILWAQCDDRLVQFKPSILALSASVCSCSSADDKAAIRDLGKQMCKNKKDDFELLKRCIGLMETAYPLDKCQSKHKASEEDSLMKLKLEWIEQMQPSEDGVGMCSLYQQALGWICRLC